MLASKIIHYSKFGPLRINRALSSAKHQLRIQDRVRENLGAFVKPDLCQTAGVVLVSCATLGSYKQTEAIMQDVIQTAALAAAVGSVFRNLGVLGMTNGTITHKYITQSLTGFDHRASVFRTLLVECTINKHIVALLDELQNQLDLDVEPGSTKEKKFTLLKISLANIVATAFALRSDCLTINKNMTNPQFNKLYLTGFVIASIRNLASALAVVFNDDIRAVCNIEQDTLAHKLLTLGLGASAAIIHKKLVDIVTMSTTTNKDIKFFEPKKLALGMIFRAAYALTTVELKHAVAVISRLSLHFSPADFNEETMHQLEN